MNAVVTPFEDVNRLRPDIAVIRGARSMRDTNGNEQVALQDSPSTTNEVAKSTRRTALRLTGGGVALALFASRLTGSATAQEASPEAGTTRVGAHAVVRTRKVKPDTSIDDLSAKIRDGLMPEIE